MNQNNSEQRIVDDILANIEKKTMEYIKVGMASNSYYRTLLMRVYNFNKSLFESEKHSNFPIIEKKLIKFVSSLDLPKSEKNKLLSNYYSHIKSDYCYFGATRKIWSYEIFYSKNKTKRFHFQEHYAHLTTNFKKQFYQDQIAIFGEWRSDSYEWVTLKKMIRNGEVSFKSWYDYSLAKPFIKERINTVNNSLWQTTK